jgi:predicted outer membrane repeat protein
MAPSFWQRIARHVFRGHQRPCRPARRPHSRLALTILEDRTLLSTLVVTNLLDHGDGSLRDQIAASAAGDTITFDRSLNGTITLTSGELDIPHDLTIQGPGAATLTVSGNNAQRVFHIEPNAAVTIADLTIANGRVRDVGGGIDCEGSLVLSNSVVTANFAQMGAGVYFVVRNTASAGLAVSGSTFTNNTGVNGTGIFSSVTVRSGSVGVTVTNSTFTNNNAFSDGGAIDGVESVSATASATFSVSGGTFSGNQAGTGGAIALTVTTTDAGQATATVSGATIQRNSAQDGGGIASRVTSAGTSQAAALISGNIIESNTAGGNGGGLFSALTSSDDGQAMLTFAGSTSARMDANTATLGAGIYSTETTTGSGSAAAAFNSSNIFGNIASDSGGGLYSLLTDSGAGTASLTLTGGSITANQAVISRAGGVYATGTTSGTGAVNITITSLTVSANMARTDAGGIYASVLNTGSGPVTSPASLTVDSSTISNNTGHSGGGLFLGVFTSQGTGAASAMLSHDTISGNRAAAGGGSGGIEASVGANGFGPASLAISSTTVSGNSADAIGGGLDADLGLNGPGAAALTVTGSTFSGNNAGSEGGGLRVRAGTNFFGRVPSTVDVTLTDTTISGNRARTGAGLYLELDAEDSVGGRVRASVNSSTISGNTATGQGGGIYAQEQATPTTTATLTLVNSTLYGNRAGTGGGLYNNTLAPDGVVGVTLRSTTVAFNSAGTGGGIAEAGEQFTVSSSIVAANTADTAADASGNFVSADYNLIGQTDGSGGWLRTDLTGTADNPFDAGFGDFGNFGGPTKTLSLLEDSPAVGQGSPGSPATDQRGVVRNPVAPSIGAFDFVKPSSFLVTAAVQTIPAGVSFTVTVAAVSADSSFLTGYAGTIHFSSSDPDAMLPADYTFTPADRGQHTFTEGVTLQTEGHQTVSVTGTGATGTVTITVTGPSVSRVIRLLAKIPAQSRPGLMVTPRIADTSDRGIADVLSSVGQCLMNQTDGEQRAPRFGAVESVDGLPEALALLSDDFALL